ncbi:MAG: outer membrane protein beta-barrel domain [Bacteroidales bacterium]|nr:outer membrane protein beta-barrel domain [Bacteroidales bacterium]
MLKNIVLLQLIILSITTVYAQEIEKGLSFSLKSGITFANMYGPDVPSETFLNSTTPETFYANHPASDDFKTGFNLGIIADFRINRFLSIGLGASYIQKGAQINATESWNSSLQLYESVKGEIYWNQNFWTLEMPITLYIPLKSSDFYIQAGFFKGFLIKSEETGDISISGSDYEYTRDRHANETEPGFFVGCGYLYPFKNGGNIFAEVLWSRSIIQSPGSDMIPNPQYYYNQTVSINFGYRYYIRNGDK